MFGTANSPILGHEKCLYSAAMAEHRSPFFAHSKYNPVSLIARTSAQDAGIARRPDKNVLQNRFQWKINLPTVFMHIASVMHNIYLQKYFAFHRSDIGTYET